MQNTWPFDSLLSRRRGSFGGTQMRLRWILAVSFIVFWCSPRSAPRAETHAPPPGNLEIGIEEKLGSYVPLNLGFVDADSDSVYLRNVIDKPTILTLVYYHCPDICLPLLNGVADVVAKTDLEPGKDYDILTISFDPFDNPVTAGRIRKTIMTASKKKLPEGAWRFLTGDSVTIAALTGATGFRVKRIQRDFAHGTTLIVLSPKGKIVRYLYGLSYLPFDIKMAVAEASEGKVTPSVARVLRFCFSYDPKAEKYVLNLTRIVGGFVVVAALALVLTLVVLGRKKQKVRA
jgi:protein SCO1